MSNFQYTTDLKADALWRAGEPTDGTSDYDAVCLTYLNRIYQAVWQGGQELAPDINEDWLWLSKTGVLTITPGISTGSVSVTKGSTAVTFSNSPTDSLSLAVSVSGWFLRIVGHQDVFRISSHIAGQTTATLDSTYTGDTASGASYDVFPLEYTLASDVLRLKSPMWARTTATQFPYSPGKISVMDLSSLRELYPLDRIASTIPSAAAMVADQIVRFNTWPTGYMRIEYDYLRVPPALTGAALEEPVIPLKDRRILADGALGFLFADKNDDRSASMGQAVNAQLQAMANENRARMVRTDKTIGKIYPRIDRLNRAYPNRTSGGLIV